jgi:SnoaL-like domain
MAMRRSSATDPGGALVSALAERDFDRLAEALAPDVRMRALIPPGSVELSGAEPAAARFATWFGALDELELIRSGSDEVGDRLHVFYRLRVKRPGDSRKVVEQHVFCAIDDGRIAALDLVCSGFRPDPAARERRTGKGEMVR